MAKRKAISSRVRFEVFKRDSFKCQYCGASSPDVILHVDHIKPVAKGGDNSITNLITSCESCNLGKSDVELDDSAAVNKQKAMLDEMNVRREQLEMMLAWRDMLKGIDDMAINAVSDEIEQYAEGSVVNATGRKKIKAALKSYSLSDVLDAIDKFASARNGTLDDENTNKLINNLKKICGYKDMPEDKKKIHYIGGILRNRVYFNSGAYYKMMQVATDRGINLDGVQELAKTCKNWTEFKTALAEACGVEGF